MIRDREKRKGEDEQRGKKEWRMDGFNPICQLGCRQKNRENILNTFQSYIPATFSETEE